MGNLHRLTTYLEHYKIVTDGSFGTYYAQKYNTNEMPELANTDLVLSERVLAIHKEYRASGAMLIRTNTFASNTVLLNSDMKGVIRNINSAIEIAKKSCGDECYIAGDIGPIPMSQGTDIEAVREQYFEIGKCFIENGIDIITFETFPEADTIIPVIKKLKEISDNPIFVMVQFSVNQFGYSQSGLSAGKLIQTAMSEECIDATGLNCGVGPGHMEQIIKRINIRKQPHKFLIALPNAGYPQRIRNNIRFLNNPEYFVDKSVELAKEDAVDILGGCCGTTPEFISRLSEAVDRTQTPITYEEKVVDNPVTVVEKKSFLTGKLGTGRKLIAVELAPPVGANDEKLMEAARFLENLGVDVVTFPDSPSGRTRIDSILMAGKVHKETGMCVMPHICCRDKNAIAMRSSFLGAYINDIHNFLIITGDPVPTMARQTTKAVFNFDSVGLMNIVKDMNEENFAQSPLSYGGAINQGRLNLDVEIGRVRRKMEAGAEFFLTQPIFTREDAERVRTIKNETNAVILCGIMPLISRKNAMFMKNEIAGVNISDEVIERYPQDGGREDGERIGIAIAKEIISYTEEFADGYYFSFPFNRVHMLKDII